jgi:hypothetical protein
MQRIGRDLRTTDSDFFLSGHEASVMDGCIPDPDDPATAGCLLALLEPAEPRPYRRPGGLWVVATVPYMETIGIHSLPLGRACIAAAEALGRWPGGAA